MTLLDEPRKGPDHPEHQATSAEERELDRIENHLLVEYSTLLGRATVSAVFRSAVAMFDGATVRLYIPLLSERAARQHLHMLVERTDLEHQVLTMGEGHRRD